MADIPAVLTLHAVDTAAEEGVVVDAAVLGELGCRPLQVITAVLAAGAHGPHALEGLSPALVAQQFEAVLEIARPRAVRVGLLRTPEQVRLLAELLRTYHLDGLVLAPPRRLHRTEVQDAATREAIAMHLEPLCRVCVVRACDLAEGNGAPELPVLRAAAAALRSRGARAVLIAGAGWHGRIVDLLDEEGAESVLDTARVCAPRIAGLASAHAAALAAHLAHGRPLLQAAEAAQRYVAQRLQRGR
ncbi:MAG TPA: bifunctional hydroxymethylpyrimidine kinase/phosphomethylpyrimidine kinase [Candidatus Polarisedimenticolaceae bacterium]|nr:bifunctional hydroxymethylpyrimidine kinase/phosphomethylpyrimidine kinase [Candidatus Polarisedimenticolaceae bacterium]